MYMYISRKRERAFIASLLALAGSFTHLDGESALSTPPDKQTTANGYIIIYYNTSVA